MTLKLYSVAVNPPNARYCAGGWAVVLASNRKHAKAVLKEKAPHVHQVGEPEELPFDASVANVLFLETYQE